MSDTPERKRPRAPVSKKRRAPVPARKKKAGEASGSPEATPEAEAPDAEAPDAAAQQAAAQKAAAQKAAAEQAALQKAAAQKAAAQQAALQKAAAQKAAAQQAALQKAAAQKAAAQKAAAQKAAAQKAAAQAGDASPAAAQKAAAQKAAAQKAAAQKAAAQKAGGAPAAATPKRPSAPKAGAPRRAAAPRPGAGRAPARAPGRPRRAAAASPDGDAGESSTFVPAPQGASKIPLIGGIIAVVVVVVLAFVVLGGGKDPVVDPPVTDSGPTEPQVDPRIQESQDALERALAHQRSEPTDYEGIVEHFEYVARNFPSLPAGKEAGDKRAAVLDSWRSAVEEARRALEQKVTDHQIAHEYSAAIAALQSPPEVFSGAVAYFGDENPVFRWMENQRRDLRVMANAYERLKELEEKAARYAEHEDIARAILTVGFPDKYEEDAPTVWALQQETIASIERDGLQRWLEKERGAEAARAEAELLAKQEAERQRRERWQSLKGSVEWVPHLGRHNLYNWIASSDRLRRDPLWRLIDREGVGVLIGDNSSESDMYMGPFTNHWIDYVLEFDVKVREGKLQVSARTQLTQVRGFSTIGDQTSPMFELSEETGLPLDRWVTVHIEVNGDSMVANFDGAPEPIVLDPETTRSPETGGFIFWVENGSRVEIRNVRSKLVNSSRDGPF